MNGKEGYSFSVKFTETQREEEMLGFHPYFDIRHNQESRAVSCRLRPHFTPKVNSLVLFMFVPCISND